MKKLMMISMKTKNKMKMMTKKMRKKKLPRESLNNSKNHSSKSPNNKISLNLKATSKANLLAASLNNSKANSREVSNGINKVASPGKTRVNKAESPTSTTTSREENHTGKTRANKEESLTSTITTSHSIKVASHSIKTDVIIIYYTHSHPYHHYHNQNMPIYCHSPLSYPYRYMLHDQFIHFLLPALGIDFLIRLCCSYCSDLGFLTVSSIERMVHAASVAAFKAFTFTSSGSQTNAFLLLPMP